MSEQIEIQEPAGIAFFSIRTGETHYCKLEPTIAAYINSSDMGINASRGQDYGWRLGKEWVAKIRAFRRDATQMAILTAKNSGQKPTTVQILYYMYGEQLQAFFEAQEEHENPFEEEYQKAISRAGVDTSTAPKEPELPAALADFRAANDEDDDADDITDLIDDVLTPEEQKAADDAELARMEEEEKAAAKSKDESKSSQKKQ
jgi:hypothetical protein